MLTTTAKGDIEVNLVILATALRHNAKYKPKGYHLVIQNT